MKTIGLWLVLGGAVGAWGQAVANIRFDNTGDSSTRVIYDVSANITTSRVRYGISNCSGGSGGMVQTNTSVAVFGGGFPRYDMTQNISGLAPGTTYYACPEVSSNGGTSWSSGVSATFTTLARTKTLPSPPAPVPTEFPVQTGNVLNVAADCSDFQSKINSAMPGDTIVVPAGTICTSHYTTPTAPDAILFHPADVRTSDSQITLTAHPFTENQEVRVSAGAANSHCLPGMLIFGSPTNNQGFNCDIGGSEWRKGGKYWVHVVDANHVQLLSGAGGSPAIPGYIVFTANSGTSTITFKPTMNVPGGYTYLGASGIPANSVVQFHSTGTLPGGLSLNTNYYLLSACAATPQAACSTQVSLSSSGAPVTITSAGTGTHRIVDQGQGNLYIMPAPAALGTPGADVVITSDGSLPPSGVRTRPEFDTQMFHIRQMNTVSLQPMFTPGILAHNWRVQGVVFDTGTNTDYLTTVDPRPYCGILTLNQDTSNFVFDRARVQGAGYPNRFGCSTAIYVDGANVGFLNSDLRGMDYWHPWAEVGGFVGTFNSNTATLTPGTYHGGVFTGHTTANTVIHVSSGGGVTGTIYAYFAMDGTLKVQPPNGVALTCTTVGTSCTVLAGMPSPTWPVNTDNRVAAGRLAQISLTSGVVTGICAVGPDANGCLAGLSYTSQNNTEGTLGILAGRGPGPYILDNNYISGSGIPVHFDDSGGGFQDRGDYTVTRNTFDVPLQQIAGQPGSNGLRYGHRNTLEWKGGKRTLVAGNIFLGSFSEISPACVTIAVTPRQGGTVTDFDFRDNSVTGCGGLNLPTPVDSQPVSPPGRFMRVANNVFTLDGWKYYVPGIGAPRGWVVEAGYGYEDALIDHNTSYDGRGVTPHFLFQLHYPSGGVAITNNVYFYTGDGAMIYNDDVPTVSGGFCTGLRDKAFMDCGFTSGPGVPSYTFRSNLIVPSWQTTQMPAGFVGAGSVRDAFPSPLVNSIPNQGSRTGALNQIGFAAATEMDSQRLDLRLGAQSPYRNTATDGTQVGADIERLLVAQGRISQLRTTMVGANTVTVSANVAQAGQACYVGYGTSNSPAMWTWTAADTATSRQRNISLSGLTSGQQYFYTVACNHSAIPSIETFRTQ